MSKQRSVLLNQDMVRALLDGSKTMTRRLMNPAMLCGGWMFEGKLGTITSNHPKKGKFGAFIRNLDVPSFPQTNLITSPLGKVGDRLYVRERARLIDDGYDGISRGTFRYEADGQVTGTIEIPDRIKPITPGNCCSNGCFKELARIWEDIVKVRVERIQDISEADAKAEGVIMGEQAMGHTFTAREHFQGIWNACYPGSWERNDYVFVYDIERCEKP